MDQIILVVTVVVMAKVALCWWVSMTPRRTVNAPVRVAQGLSLHRSRNRR